MKTTGDQKMKVLGTDQSSGAQEIDDSCRKEKKEKMKIKKQIEVDKDALMTSQEEERKKEKSEKKSKKKHKEENGERVKEKETMTIVTINDDDKSQVEKQEKKKKRKKEQEDDVFNDCEDKRETKKRKKDRMVVYDKETKEKKEKEEEVDKERKKNEKMDAVEDDNVEEKKKKKRKEKNEKEEEGDKEKKKKEKMDAMEVDNEEKKKKKRKDRMVVDGTEKKEKSKKEEGGDNEEQKKETMDSMEGDNDEKKKKKKEKKEKRKKEKKDDVLNSCGDEREMKKTKKKDKNEKTKEKKRKEKKTQDADVIADDEKQKKKGKKVRFSDNVEVYPPPAKLANSSGKSKEEEEGGLVRGKRFTKEEDEMIKKAVSDYIEANHLGEEGLDMVLHCKSHPKIKNCWKEIGAAMPWRPYLSVYYRAHILYERGERKWTPEELELVRKAHAQFGPNWKMIAQELGKFRVHVKDAWRRIKLIDMKKGNWSQQEYQTLFELVNKDLKMKLFEEKKSKHGMLRDNICWGAISDKLGTRQTASCCTKWYDQLTSPMVAQGKWSDTDDYRLLMELVDLDASCEDEVDWENLLEHRSADQSRMRWQQMVRHLGVHGTKSFSEQVEVLSERYCADLLEVRETLAAKPYVD